MKNNIEKNLFLDIHPLFTLLSIILFYANLILFDDWSLIYIDENFNPYETFYGKYYFKYDESKICNHVFFETFFLEDQKIIEEISKKMKLTQMIYIQKMFLLKIIILKKMITIPKFILRIIIFPLKIHIKLMIIWVKFLLTVLIFLTIVTNA